MVSASATAVPPDRLQRYTVFFVCAALVATVAFGLKPAPARSVAVQQPSPIILVITATPLPAVPTAPPAEQPIVQIAPSPLPTAEPVVESAPPAEVAPVVEQPAVVEQAPVVLEVAEAAPTVAPAVEPIAEHGSRPSNRPGPGDSKKAAP